MAGGATDRVTREASGATPEPRALVAAREWAPSGPARHARPRAHGTPSPT